MRTFILIAMLVGLPMQAQAQAYFWTGNELVERMREWDKYQAGQRDIAYIRAGFYLGYVTAATDSFESVGLICMPESVTIGQATAAVGAYLKANPKRWGEAAIYLVHAALVEAFPCW